MNNNKVFAFILLCFLFSMSFAQSKKELKESERKKILKDSLDNKLDFSDWLMSANGFVPMPQIVTEPALGGGGLMLAPIFIKPNKVQVKDKYIPPNITAAFAAYTANDTWGFGVLRMASLPNHKLKYRIGAAYVDMNMDFYRELPSLGSKKFSFNFKSVPFFVSVMKEISNNLFVGLQYFYMKSEITPQFDFIDLPFFVDRIDLKSTISNLGIGLDFDTRDNVFSPNKGTQIGSNFKINAKWLGSDYDFKNFNASVFQYFQPKPHWVSGFRFDTKFIFDDAPFYMEPFVELRGVPAVKYQGESTFVIETEQRYDFSMRWSGIAFTGLGKAIQK